MTFLPMPFEIRLAWRDIRPAIKKFLFMISAIGLGVGSVTGIRGFSEALDHSMSRSARDIIAADIAVRMGSLPTEKETRILESLVERGAQLTRVTETLSMASGAEANHPVLATVKAIDPGAYPYYGMVELEPALPFRKTLTDDCALASKEFMIRTGTSLGNLIQIGAGRFRIAAVLKGEPDRIS